ncbi:MAG: hypothetical protein E6I30_11445 [Chloroflexi bacterium]|nr:MAG: hypothetical protein E6I30_11445 [Chloroflexota bacterium]
MTSAPERHLIKKYANRKLYDTRTSRYITLDQIAQLVRDGHEIKVVDRGNGGDLTQVTLSQIVLSEEKRGPSGIVDAGRRDRARATTLAYPDAPGHRPHQRSPRSLFDAAEKGRTL